MLAYVERALKKYTTRDLNKSTSITEQTKLRRAITDYLSRPYRNVLFILIGMSTWTVLKLYNMFFFDFVT